MSFQVGDEVYVRCVVRGKPDRDGLVPITVGVAYQPEYLIPASRVTVAKARRAARMPEDHGKTVTAYDNSVPYGEKDNGILIGMHGKKFVVYTTKGFQSFDTAEVEE